jgi:hypothetical protein
VATEAVRPWFCRLLDAVPAPPFGAALVVAASLLLAQAVALGLDHGLSSVPLALAGDVVAHAVLFAAGTAYVLWVGWMVVEGAARDVAALRPALRGSASEVERVVHSLTAHEPRRLLAATAAGPLVPFALALAVPSEGGHPAARLLAGRLGAGFDDLYFLACQLLFWLAMGPVAYVLVVGLLRFWRLGRRHVRVDLLDLDALAPFARVGLRLALVVLGGVAVLLTPVAALGWRPGFVESLILAPIVAAGFAALLSPSLGVHGAIRRAKAAELERVRSAIAGNRAALAGSAIAAEADRLSVVDLLRYRGEIAAVREWPFDAGVLRRFGLYLLIPLASWVLGALVERLVDRALG